MNQLRNSRNFWKISEAEKLVDNVPEPEAREAAGRGSEAGRWCERRHVEARAGGGNAQT